MKKTLIITMEFLPTIGGIATYVDALAGELEQEKIIVLAPLLKTGEKEVERPYNILRRPFLYPRFLWPRWMRLFWHVRKIVKSEGIECIMVHHTLPVGYIAWCINKFMKIPYILFSHGTDVIVNTRNRWKQTLVAFVSKDAEVLVFNSQSLKERFLVVFPHLAEKSLVLYPCPDPIFLTPPPADRIAALQHQYALDGKRVLLSIGRFVDGKGFPHLLGHVAEIVKHVPHLVLLVIGDGPKRADILAFIEKYSLQNVVRLLGEMPHEALRDFYYLAELFVLLTHPDEGREEGLGLVFLEAASVGLPVIAGRSGGVEEAVIHSQTGIVVDVFQGRQVREAMKALLDQPGYGKQLGEQAKRRIQEEFVWTNQIGKLERWIT